MKERAEVLLDELLKDYQTPEQILGENGILKQLTKRLAERALQAEMTHHLGYAKHDYQSKANKETLDNLINHNTDDDLLEELPSAEEETIQPSTLSEETVSLAGKPARKKGNARNGTTKKPSVPTLVTLNLMFPETVKAVSTHSLLKNMNAR